MELRRGDRVRIRNPRSEYFGCRGTVASEPVPDVLVLGHDVAVDGENGVTRPFLLGELEPLRAVRARPRNAALDEVRGRSGSVGAPGGLPRPRSR